jgi:hypothetical protein
MRYNPDLNRITLDAYRGHLKRQTLLPSRRLLLDDVDEQFARIQSQGIATVAALLKALSSPAKIEHFAAQSGVSARYLTILKREIGTLKPKVVPLREFPGVDA